MLGLNTNLLIALFLRLSEHGYLIAFLATLLETVLGFGLIFPGSAIVLILGAVAGHGYLDISKLMFFSIFAALLGDNINYFLGKKYGSKLIRSTFLNEKFIDRAKKYIKSKPYKGVLRARLIPTLKELIPFVAGCSKLNFFKFFLFNIFGIFAWVFFWIFGGYLLGQSLNLFGIWVTRSEYLMVILLLFAFVYYFIEWLFQKKGQQFFAILRSITLSIAHALANNFEIKTFLKKHERIAFFIKKRLTPKKFYGLKLTSLTVLFLYVLWLYIELIDYSFFSNPIIVLDENVTNLLNIFRVDSFIRFFLWISLLMKVETILVFSIISVTLLWVWNKISYIFPFFITLLGSALTMRISKIFFERARPEHAVYFEPTYSFPSGHATMSVAFFAFIAYVLIKLSKKWKRKVNIFFISFGIILAIGFSRLYLGVHYLTDVWGGYLIGMLWLIFGIGISEWILERNRKTKKSRNHHIFYSYLLIFVGFLFYIFYGINYSPVLNHIKEIEIIQSVQDLKSLNLSDSLKYTESIFGKKLEPISFITTADSDKTLVNIFEEAGWYLAEPLNLITIKKMGASLIFNNPYRDAPITPAFWNTEINTFGFEKPTDKDNFKERHHARFWKSNFVTESGQFIYVGTASFDNGIKWGVTHIITPDIDTEREFLFNDLLKTGSIGTSEKIQFVNPMLGQNFAKDQFFTDGQTYLISFNE